MKLFLIGIILSIFSCHSSKKAVVETAAPEGSKVTADSLPVCVQVLIEKFKSEPMANPPRKIYRYIYDDQKVYYVPPVCCDNFSDLYNDSCRVMAHPDGGFTGKGDRKLPDFNERKSGEVLLWEDVRGR